MKKKKRSLFPLTMHGVVSLLLPIPCFLMIFVLNAFFALLVPGSMEAGVGTFFGVMFMLVSCGFSVSGIWRGVQTLQRSKRGGKRFRRSVACLAMCALGLIEFIILLVFTLRH